MGDPDIESIARTERRKRRLPPGAMCGVCGGRQHPARGRDGRVLCYEHRREAAGASTIEADHIAGRANLGGLVVHLRANDHRTVTELRQQLGLDAWPAADGDPVLIVAHLLAGLATLLWLVGEWLVELAADAKRRLGEAGWSGAPLAPVVA